MLMMAATLSDPVMVILSATARASLRDALAWLAEDHPMPGGTDWAALVGALVRVDDKDSHWSRALRRAVRHATSSDYDTSRMLFEVSRLNGPGDFARALTTLLGESVNGTFGGLTPRAVLRAQDMDPLCIKALCLAVGVTYRDAEEWYRDGAEWTLEAVGGLLEYLTRLVDGTVKAPMPGTTPARGVELVFGLGRGWAYLDALRAEGVPYEVLLAQRAAGGPWHAHKNATTGRVNDPPADAVAHALDERRIEYRRSSTVGGTASQRDLQKLCGIADKRIGLVVVRRRRAVFAVVFSSAHDGGTARANGDGLMHIPHSPIPVAVVLTGGGWADRIETDRLAMKFHGRVFTERTLSQLVQLIAEQP